MSTETTTLLRVEVDGEGGFTMHRIVERSEDPHGRPEPVERTACGRRFCGKPIGIPNEGRAVSCGVCFTVTMA
jgi:hypothetical protein